MNTIENNKIIVLFMGWELREHNVLIPCSGFTNGQTRLLPKESGFYEADVSDLCFDYDWNWLMPIVEKIESILPDDSTITIEYKSCYIPDLKNEITFDGYGETKIQAVYNACVQFIQWYNQQPK